MALQHPHRLNKARRHRRPSATVAPRQLPERPRSGRQLDQYLPREVRRIIVANYEMRYELVDGTVTILRVWHTREER